MRACVQHTHAQLDANNVLLAAAEHSMMRTNEMASLLAEKAKISEEEALVLAKRASEAEAEIQRVKLTAYQTEEAKMQMERRVREAELFVDRRQRSAEQEMRTSFTTTPVSGGESVQRNTCTVFRRHVRLL